MLNMWNTILSVFKKKTKGKLLFGSVLLKDMDFQALHKFKVFGNGQFDRNKLSKLHVQKIGVDYPFVLTTDARKTGNMVKASGAIIQNERTPINQGYVEARVKYRYRDNSHVCFSIDLSDKGAAVADIQICRFNSDDNKHIETAHIDGYNDWKSVRHRIFTDKEGMIMPSLLWIDDVLVFFLNGRKIRRVRIPKDLAKKDLYLTMYALSDIDNVSNEASGSMFIKGLTYISKKSLINAYKDDYVRSLKKWGRLGFDRVEYGRA